MTDLGDRLRTLASVLDTSELNEGVLVDLANYMLAAAASDRDDAVLALIELGIALVASNGAATVRLERRTARYDKLGHALAIAFARLDELGATQTVAELRALVLDGEGDT